MGLIVIFVYAFFKFAWAYRLFNYVAILLGATPPSERKDTPEAQAHVMRTTRLFQSAGRHFNRGQRAFSSRSDISAGSSVRVGAVRDDAGGGHRHLAQTVRFRSLSRHGGMTLVVQF